MVRHATIRNVLPIQYTLTMTDSAWLGCSVIGSCTDAEIVFLRFFAQLLQQFFSAVSFAWLYQKMNAIYSWKLEQCLCRNDQRWHRAQWQKWLHTIYIYQWVSGHVSYMPELEVDTYMHFYDGIISHRIITTLLVYCARERPIRKAIISVSPLFLLLSSHIIRLGVHRGLHTPHKL